MHFFGISIQKRSFRHDVPPHGQPAHFSVCYEYMNVSTRDITAIPSLMHWRAEMIEHTFGAAPSKRLLAASRQYYRKHIADGTHAAIVATADGDDAGCGAICLSEELPSPDNPSGRCACLMNIYVRREYRGSGICHAIVRRLVEKARQAGCSKIYLETSDGNIHRIAP